ncbi:hypothetical protein Hanom_Chr11g01045281 [Helianthus anomalus]
MFKSNPLLHNNLHTLIVLQKKSLHIFDNTLPLKQTTNTESISRQIHNTIV